ncbi:MAG: histidine phosphatase family protein [Chloroflexales bacterium]|nr:histidine phosphatase family protein [Chloroflexales bacterium]
MLLTIVRHGECLGQTDPQFWADPDSPLSALGVQQAAQTAAQLAQADVTHLISSPLIRALATAQAIAAACQLPSFAVWPNLREGFSGTYQGWPRSRMQAAFPQAVLAEAISEAGWAHGDHDYAAFWARCAAVIAALRAQQRHTDHVVLVTHGGCANNLIQLLLGIDRLAPQWFDLANGAISRLRLVADPQAERPDWPLYPPVAVEVQCLNATAHLRLPPPDHQPCMR